MIETKVGPTALTLPLSDEALYRLDPEDKLHLFLPVTRVQGRCEAYSGLTDILPDRVELQELNMLAFLLDWVEEKHRSIEPVRTYTKMAAGVLINRLVALCPEAVGLPEGSAPLYTGENLFDLMAYKRFLDWKREYPDFQIVKFYVPVDVTLLPRGADQDVELDGREAAAYQRPISDMLARHVWPMDECSDWTNHFFFLESCMHREYGLLFERPDVEVRDGELWGVVVAGVSRRLNDQELDALKGHVDGGISDAWGEDIPRAECPEGGLHISLDCCTEVLQQALDELTLTEQEAFQLLAPRNAERLLNATGFVPDFRDKWEYAGTQPIWLELSAGRKTVRIALPADADALDKAHAQLETSHCHSRLHVTHNLLMNFSLSEPLDMKALNTLATHVRTQPKGVMEQASKLSFSRGLPQDDKIVTALLQALEEIVSPSPDEEHRGLEYPSM